MDDPYRTLGVAQTATAEEIKQAYRKLAKKLHPDMHPGNRTNEARFKEVTAAYDLLSDADKRARFDRGEIDAGGAERARRWSAGAGAERGSGAGPGRAGAAGGRFGFDFADDIFADLFGRHRRGGQQAPPPPEGIGHDVRIGLRVPFLDAVKGSKRPVHLPDGRVVNVNVPPGAEDGMQLRLRGQAVSPFGPAGDVYVTIEVEPHAEFTREGADIHSTVPITIGEALAGATIRVETVDGPVDLKVAPGANSGTRLRLRGKGAAASKGARGDHYVTLSVKLPDPPDKELSALVERWAQAHPYKVRPES